MNTFFRLVSFIINPLMIAPCSFGLLIYFNDLPQMKHTLFLICIIFNTILPLITIFYFIKSGKVTSLDVPIKEQRIQLLAIGAIYHSLGFILLNYFGAPTIVKGVMFCYALNTVIVWAITRYWKISVHMIGLGGPIVALWLAGFHYPKIMGITIILVSISRIVLKAHTPTQVLAGTLLAMILTYIELTYLFL